MTPLLTIPLLAFATTVVLHFAALHVFPWLGLLDFPERYGLQRRPIPYPTGILAVLTFCAFFAVLQPWTTQNIGLLLGIVLLMVCCFTDDRLFLSPFLRFGIQALVAVVVIAAGVRIGAVTNPLPGVLAPESSIVLSSGWLLAFSVAFTLIWLLFTINALNWFDGIPGQVSTLSVIGFLTIGFLSLSARVDQPALALLSFILAGIALGILIFDFSPPRVLMGDTGAMFFGLMIGVLTIYSGGKVATAFLVLGVPLIDVLFVVVRRLHRGQSPFRGNSTDQHLHHRLLKKGWSPRQVIVLTAGIGALFGITALFLSTGGKVIAGLLLLIVMLGLSWYSGKNGKL
ncbi:undecaprenyl/decaprenyl-phosphate alpha-N-acetylglucosaminyl 1-phosphate transferase [Candidatus Peribacteria bacterium]|nr:undecaprenyl/decaprenyl-phosphate alpha-N-acetylglucosaminyl 1-phosphate transferase [Candidatus Peribacteria bacterium]